jgi:ABC-2 type transport system ATP-binding protein
MRCLARRSDVAVEIRARIGYMPENDAIIPRIERRFIRRLLRRNWPAFVCADAISAPEVLFYVGLGEARYRNVDTYSTGMKQRIEAGAGAGPRSRSPVSRRADKRHGSRGRRDAGSAVRDLAHNKGVSLILSSSLPDVSTCDHVIVMDKGRDVTPARSKSLKQPRAASMNCASRRLATSRRSSIGCARRPRLPRDRHDDRPGCSCARRRGARRLF